MRSSWVTVCRHTTRQKGKGEMHISKLPIFDSPVTTEEREGATRPLHTSLHNPLSRDTSLWTKLSCYLTLTPTSFFKSWMQGTKDATQERSKHRALDKCEGRTRSDSRGAGLEDHQPEWEQDGSSCQWVAGETIQLEDNLRVSQLKS